MTRATGLLTLTLLAVPASLALLAPTAGQTTPPTKAGPIDWTAMVRKAHTHRRMMIRRAAARKVARAGDEAIPGVRTYQNSFGRDRISLELVTEYQRATSDGERTLTLLEEWATDTSFYWRSQALGALANRKEARFTELFHMGLTDPAFLTRIQAGRGLCLLDVDRDDVLSLLRDPDPRVRLRIAICLVEQKDDRGLPSLVQALRQDGSFLDYPWGALGANRAFRLLSKVCGEEFGYQIGESLKTNGKAVSSFDEFVRKRLGDRYRDAVAVKPDRRTYAGGVEIRSCRNGDLFLRWTAKGEIVFGLEARAAIDVGEKRLATFLTGLPEKGKGIQGKVVCDYLRLMCQNRQQNQKFAPGALSSRAASSLENLAQLLSESGADDRARQISSRLTQFKPTRKK